VRRPTQPTAVLVIEKDGLEAGTMSVEKELVLGAVEKLGAFPPVAEQSVWMTFKHQQRRLEVLTAHVYPQSSPLLHLCRRRGRQPVRHTASFILYQVRRKVCRIFYIRLGRGVSLMFVKYQDDLRQNYQIILKFVKVTYFSVHGVIFQNHATELCRYVWLLQLQRNKTTINMIAD